MDTSTTYAEGWDRCWDAPENQPWYPDEQMVRFLAQNYVRKMGFGPTDVRYVSGDKPKGLEVGCGKGRHVVLMSQLGIEAHGVDISEAGVKFTDSWLKAWNLEGTVSVNSDSLDYPNDSFDFILSHGVFDHMLLATREALYKEIYRTLKLGGRFFVSLIAEDDSAFGEGELIEDKTWILSEGFESGLPQAFFDIERIERELGNHFSIENITKCGCETIQGRSLIGTDKHYAKDSRYFVSVRKDA